MPDAPAHACHVARCPELIPRGGQCPHHGSRKRRDGERGPGSTGERGYGHSYQKARAYKVATTPLCERCARQGRTVLVQQVHHKDGDTSNNAWENLESLCTACHGRETRARQGGPA